MLLKNYALFSVISRPRDGHNGSRRSARRLFPVWLLVLCSIAAPLACADEPLLGFSYTTDLLPKGKFELRHWFTTRFHKYPGGMFWLQENRTEEEDGFRDKWQLALYQV